MKRLMRTLAALCLCLGTAGTARAGSIVPAPGFADLPSPFGHGVFAKSAAESIPATPATSGPSPAGGAVGYPADPGRQTHCLALGLPGKASEIAACGSVFGPVALAGVLGSWPDRDNDPGAGQAAPAYAGAGIAANGGSGPAAPPSSSNPLAGNVGGPHHSGAGGAAPAPGSAGGVRPASGGGPTGVPFGLSDHLLWQPTGVRLDLGPEGLLGGPSRSGPDGIGAPRPSGSGSSPSEGGVTPIGAPHGPGDGLLSNPTNLETGFGLGGGDLGQQGFPPPPTPAGGAGAGPDFFPPAEGLDPQPSGIQATPEPSSLALAGIAAVCLLGYTRRRRFPGRGV
jgi:hypothetical protein